MEKMNIVSFSLQELYNGANKRFSFHDGCLVSTYHGIDKNKIEQKAIPLFLYPCRVDAMTAVICEKGKVRFTSNLKQYVLQENTLCINMPNTIVKIDEIEDSIVHVMAFDENFLRDVHLDLRNLLPRFANILDNLCITILPEELDDIRQIFETIEREMETLSGKAYQKEILRGYTSIAIYKICAIFSRVMQMRETASIETVRNRREEYFREFMRHLQQHYCKERSLGFYASLLHITPKYLTTLIKQVSGRSVAEWIDECVILEAKNLLKFSTMSIQQIAYYLNFPNQSFFGTYFKRRTGMSPSEYKQS